MPADFRYREVFLRGKPQHDRYDSFRIKHPEMNVGHRAKIFSPFDALKGFSEAVAAKNVLYENKRELEKEERDELDRKIHILHNLTWNGRMAKENKVRVSVSYYVPCSDKNNESFGLRGQYKTIAGICWNVDPEVFRTIRVDKQTIGFEDILSIDSPDDIFTKDWKLDYPEE